MNVQEISSHEYDELARQFRDSIYTSYSEYIAFKRGISTLKVFWASAEELITLLGAYEGDRLIGVLRVLKYPIHFYERNIWGKNYTHRGEIQDIYIKSSKALQILLTYAEEILHGEGLAIYGISEWKPAIWRLLEEQNYSPYRRSIVIRWNLNRKIPKNPNLKISIKPASIKDKSILREIQKSSWKFFIPPDWRRQTPIIAYHNDKPVGSAYLNKAIPHLDFGVHVKEEYQRKHIGATILEYARRHYAKLGYKSMYVTRVLTLTKVNPNDRRALNFYFACGGSLAREYRGFRKKKIKRKISIPDIAEFYPKIQV